ncbi:MAG: CoB--CoM heterodisulfide reductase iron-sulfur subunit B family protein [Deltaproteobacteria bacterium]|nr:CoB--CoM heterodisulfide reductase iron-sulfur subunit B family protein [Deltaproteobacteria bacterium]
MRYGLYLGCNMPAIRPDVERAMRLALPILGIELVDLEGYACCPAFGTFPSADEIASLAISSWNLSIAEEKGVDVVVQCGSCYSSLRMARAKLLKDEEKRERVNELLGIAGKKFEGKPCTRHLIDVLYNEVGTEKISQVIKKNLKGLKAVVQYPCHTRFPSEVLGFDNPGRPRMLKEIVEALGAEVQHYSRELQCCGGSGGFARQAYQDAVKFTKKKYDAMKNETQPDMIVVNCITCLMYMDKIQKDLSKEGEEFSIPVFDYAQILALCMGFDPKEVASISVIPRDKIIEKITGAMS